MGVDVGFPTWLPWLAVGLERLYPEAVEDALEYG